MAVTYGSRLVKNRGGFNGRNETNKATYNKVLLNGRLTRYIRHVRLITFVRFVRMGLRFDKDPGAVPRDRRATRPRRDKTTMDGRRGRRRPVRYS